MNRRTFNMAPCKEHGMFCANPDCVAEMIEVDSKIKCIIKPGEVKSRTDGDWHFINADQLMRLYLVRPDECIIDNSEQTGIPFRVPKQYADLPVYGPRYDGDYPLFAPRNPEPKKPGCGCGKIIKCFMHWLKTRLERPWCFGSDPGFQTRAERDCFNCKHHEECLKR